MKFLDDDISEKLAGVPMDHPVQKLARQLQAAREELVELRGTQQAAIDEALRQQAREWCRSVSDDEGPALEQLLSQVPGGATLTVEEPIVKDGWDARWELYTEDEQERGDVEIGQCVHSSLPAAIRAATLELLGLDGPVEEPRQTCGSCEHWRRGDEPATEAGARPCGLDEEHNPAPRHPQSSCGLPGYYRALGTAKTDPAPDSDERLPGVTQPAANVIQSRGDES